MNLQTKSRNDPRSLQLNRPVGLENLDICRMCGGKCCQGHAGTCWPWDFVEPLYDNIRAALESGYYVLDYWEGQFTRGVFQPHWVRPRHTNRLDCLIDPSWGGTCIFWRESNGCQLQFEDRPTTCRITIPKQSHECDGAKKYDKEEMIKAWLPFQSIFRTLIEEYHKGELQLKKVQVET